MADISKIKTPDGTTYDVKDSTARSGLTGKVDTNQGSGNAGKFLVVGSDGYVTVVTLATWQGGDY